MARSNGVFRFGFRRLVAGAAAAVAVTMIASAPANAAVISHETAVEPDMGASGNGRDVRQYAKWRRRTRGIFYAKEGGLEDQEPALDSSVHEAAKESMVTTYGGDDKQAFVQAGEQGQAAQRDDEESVDESDGDESDEEDDRLAAEELLREADEEAEEDMADENQISELEMGGPVAASATAPTTASEAESGAASESDTEVDDSAKKARRSRSGKRGRKGGRGGKRGKGRKKKTQEEKQEDRKRMRAFASTLSDEEKAVLMKIKSLNDRLKEARKELVELRKSKNKKPLSREQKARMRAARGRRSKRSPTSARESAPEEPATTEESAPEEPATTEESTPEA